MPFPLPINPETAVILSVVVSGLLGAGTMQWRSRPHDALKSRKPPDDSAPVPQRHPHMRMEPGELSERVDTAAER
jgi:hypothetical protein